MLAPPPTHLVRLPDGRRLAFDDVGQPDGVAVVYIHGTPDTRRARHPDDGLAAECGVRLLCVDRPGFGASDPHLAADFQSFATDLAFALDELGVGSVRLLAWSAGVPWALAAASSLGSRVVAVGAASGTVPAEAFDDEHVRRATSDARLGMLEAAIELGAWEAAEMMAPMLVPDPPTTQLALEQLASHDATTSAEIASIEGALERMAEAMVDSVAAGTAGLVVDVARAYAPSGIDFGRVTCPVHLWSGELDQTCPPAFADWYAGRLPHASVSVIASAGHAVLLTHWVEFLRLLCSTD